MNVCILFAEDPKKDIEPFGFAVHSVWYDEEKAMAKVEDLFVEGVVSYYEVYEMWDEPTI